MIFSLLYRFIKKEIIEVNNVGLNAENFSSKTDKNKNNYFLYELNKKNTTINSQENSYQLYSHHISFYEMQDEKNPHLSQYHYTAYFYDRNNRHFELHVYFDQNDNLACKPIFKLKENDQINLPLDNEHLLQNFRDFAINETVDLVKSLRQHLKTKTSDLQKNYAQYELKLSFLSMDNKEAYSNLLIEILQVLEQLSYFQANSYFDSLLKWYQRSLAEIQQLTEDEKSEGLESSDEEFNASFESLTSVKEKKKVIKKSLDSHVDTTIEARDSYLNLKAKTLAKASEEELENLMQFFLDFHQNINEISLFAEDKNYQIRVENLLKIQNLSVKCTKEGQELLEKMLLNKNYRLAKHLVPYLSFVQDKMINMALYVDNGELLDFILSNAAIAINTYTTELKLKDKPDSLTSVLYCYYAKKTQCFSILVKHNASTMVLAEEGLPIAHHIASSFKHPLKDAFINHLSNAEQIQLYQSILGFFEANPQKTDEPEKMIKGYREQISWLRQANIPTVGKQSKIAGDKINKLRNKVNNQDLVNRLNADKAINEKYLVYSGLVKKYTKSLNPLQKRALVKESMPLFDRVEQITESLNLFECVSFETAKISVMSCLDKFIQIMKYKMEQVELQKIMALPVRTQKQLNKQKKKAARFEKLNQEIKQLQIESGIRSVNEAADLIQTSDAINGLTTILSQLTTLLGGFATSMTNSNELEEASVIEIDFEETANSTSTGSSLLNSNGFFAEQNRVEDVTELETKLDLS